MKRRLFLTLTVLCLLFTACENPLSVQPHDNGAYLRIDLDRTRASDGYSRTVFPDVPSLNAFTDFSLSGTPAATGVSEVLATASSVSSLASKNIKVNAGTWDFTLTAVCSGVTYTADITAFPVVAGNNDLAFVLEPDSTLTGQFIFKLNFPVGDVTKVEASLVDRTSGSVVSAPEELTVTGGKITYAKDTLTAGMYRIVIDFYGGSDSSLYLNTYRELVRIAPGLTSSAERSITSLNDVYTISFDFNDGELASGTTPESYTRRLDADIDLPVAKYEGKYFCGWYDNASFTGSAYSTIDVGTVGDLNFYAKWLEPVVYVNGSTGDNTNGGFAADDAVASVSEAFVRIKDTQDNAETVYADTELKDWTVMISNHVTGCSVMNDTDVPVNSLTISGKTGSSSDILDADGEAHAVLDIDSSKGITIKKIKITGGSSLDGGGLSIHGSSNVTIDSCQITQNEASQYGGGIYKEGTGWLSLADTSVSHNTASSGGGIYVESASTVGLSGLSGYPVRIEYNEASDSGGGIVSKAGVTYRYGYVGYNTADVNAGGIQLIGATATLYSNVIVSNNEAAADGGGVYLDGSSSILYLEGTKIASNTAGENGGGVFVNTGCALHVHEGSVIGDDSVASSAGPGTGLHSNYAKKGGGVYSDGSIVFGVSDTEILTTGGVFYNYAEEQGGGIQSSGKLLCNGGAVSYNAVGQGGATPTGNGGGIGYSGTASSKLSGVTLYKNAAGAAGAGICLFYGSKDMQIVGCQFERNAAGTSGGAIYNRASDVVITESMIRSNSASYGGGIAARDYLLTISGAGTVITKNTASTSGGGIYVGESGILSLTDGTVSLNESSGIGGGLYLSTKIMSSVSTISGATFSQNTATSSGGGICLGIADGLPCALSLSGCTIEKNISDSRGGGVYLGMDCALTMDSGSITQNTAKDASFAGAGVYNMSGVFTLTGGTISQNQATSGHGGGICNYTSAECRANNQSSEVTISGGTVSANTAGKDGGGIYNGEASTLTMTGGTVGGTASSSANSATALGDGVFNDGFMSMEGDALITSNNDVYLTEYVTDLLHPANRLINVTGTLSETVAATITPSVYADSLINATPVITGTAAMTQVGKFAVTPDGAGNDWFVFWAGTRGCIKKTGATGEVRYISETGVDAVGRGLTETTPFKTLAYAVASFTDRTAVDGDGNPTNVVYILSDYTLTQTMYNDTVNSSDAFNMIGQKSDGTAVSIYCNVGMMGSSFNVHGQNICMSGLSFEQSVDTVNSYAAVCVDGGKLTMSDCSIVNIKGSGCSALHIGKSTDGTIDGTVTLSGVNITGNTTSASVGWIGGAVNIKDGTLVIAGQTVIKDNLTDTGIPANVWMGYSQGATTVFNPIVVKTDLTGSRLGIRHGLVLTANKAITKDYAASGNSTSVSDVREIFTSDGGSGITYSGGEVCLTAGYYLEPLADYDYEALEQETSTGDGYAKPLTLAFKNSSGVTTVATSIEYTVKLGDVILMSDTITSNSSLTLELPPLQGMSVSVSAVKDGITANFGEIMSVATTDVWVSNTGSDTTGATAGYGTKDHPFATVNKSLTVINNSTADATVHIDGSVSGNSVIDDVDAATLTVTGTSAAADSLNGNNNGTTLTVETSVPVTVTKLKVTGGRKISSATGDALRTDTAGWGGGVYAAGGTAVTLGTGCEVTANTATCGGGVFVDGATFTVDGALIYGNTAVFAGGILSYTGSTTELTSGSISSNTIDSTASSDAVCGGIMNCANLTVGGTSGKTFTIDSNDSCGLMNWGGTSAKTLIKSGTTVSGHTAYSAVFVNEGEVGMSAGEITGNGSATATHNGGGVYVSENATFKLVGGSVYGNKAKNGGGIYTEGAVIVSSGSIYGNEASENGGGIHVGSTARCSVSSTCVIGGSTAAEANKAVNGGGIFNDGEMQIYGGKICGNSATSYGGGVYVNSSASINMTGGTIGGANGSYKNSAVYGGGVYSKGKVYLEDGSISYNSASTYGGGIYSDGSTAYFSIDEGEVSHNTALNSGGGVYVTGGNLVMDDTGSITQNEAKYGAGMYVTGDGGSIRLFGGSITGNRASITGGGMFVDSDAIPLLKGVTVSGNTATSCGNGVYLASGKKISLSDSSVVDSDNDVYLYGTASIYVGSELTAGTTPVATITPNIYNVGKVVLYGGAVGTEYAKIAVTPQTSGATTVNWSVNNEGALVKPDAGGISVVDDDVTVSLSSSTASSTASTKIRFSAVLDAGESTETDLTLTTATTDWTVKVFSGATDISSSTYITKTLSSTERSLTVASGIPVGTILTVYVSVIYNGRSYGGSFTVTVN